MKQKIKIIVIAVLLITALTGGFFKIKEYRTIKAEKDYGDCTIECSKEYQDAYEDLKSDEGYLVCLKICGNNYEKITGQEVTSLYERLKEKWQFDVAP